MCPDNQDPDREIPTRASPLSGDPQDGDDAEDGTDLEDFPPGQEEPEVSKRASPEVFKYLTKMGFEITEPSGAEIGQRTWWTSPKNATLFDEQTRTHAFDPDDEDDEFAYMLENLIPNEDYVVERIL